MKDDILAHLHDVLLAARAVKQFVRNKTYEDYRSDELLRSAVERKFEIVGEALNRISRDEPGMLADIRDHRNIISFRNILIHGYDAIDDRVVWGIIDDDLEGLIEDVTRLMA